MMTKLLLLAVLCATARDAGISQSPSSSNSLSGPDVIERLEAKNAERFNHQPTVVCERAYKLDYHGFPSAKHAEMTVRAETSRDGKTLAIQNESGSDALRKHVLHKLLEGEHEASSPEMQAQTRISTKNYQFHLAEVQGAPQHPIYIFDISPLRSNKFVWHGRIWIDGTDFAVVRAEGAPAKMPSWWTTASNFSYTNQKVGDQWLPEQNTSVTKVRLGGHAELVINYSDCHEGQAAAR
jgi:hypothetical protein